MTEKVKKQDCHNERMGFLNAGLPFPRPGQIVAPPAMDRCVARDPTGHMHVIQTLFSYKTWLLSVRV